MITNTIGKKLKKGNIKSVEEINKYYETDLESKLEWVKKRCPHTTNYVIPVSCDKCGKVYSKESWCGKGTCKVCGEKNSVPHLRKLSRIYPKAMEIGLFDDEYRFGHYVFTIPSEFWKVILYRGWKAFMRYERFVLKLVKEIVGLDVSGFRFRHFAGDKDDRHKFKPHIHVVAGIGKNGNRYLNKETLKYIRKRIKSFWLTDKFFRKQIKNFKMKLKDVDFGYSYQDKTPGKIHLLKYNSRFTWRDKNKEVESFLEKKPLYLPFGKYKNDYTMIDVVRNFRQDQHPDDSIEEVFNHSDLVFDSKKCMSCGGDLTFGKCIGVHTFYKKYKHYPRGKPLPSGMYESDPIEIYKDHIKKKQKENIKEYEKAEEFLRLVKKEDEELDQMMNDICEGWVKDPYEKSKKKKKIKDRMEKDIGETKFISPYEMVKQEIGI